MAVVEPEGIGRSEPERREQERLLTSGRPGTQLPSLVAERLLLPVDPEQNGLLGVVALHLHHDVVSARLLLREVLLAGPPTDLSLFVQEVEHAAQDGEQQDADDDDGDDDAFALFLDCLC